MKVLLTGGAGFIGRHLARKLLDKKHEVLALDNGSHASLPKYFYGDVRYEQDLELSICWCDVVVHLAAQINVDKSNQHPQETIDVNVKGTLNVLETALKFDKRVVFASSSEIYGTSEELYMDEKHPTNPLSPYGVSKLAGDKLCQSYHDVYGLDVSIVRNFNTFGPHQASDMYGAVISIFADRIAQGLSPEIFGDGKQARDYMYVDDAVQAYVIAIEKGFKGQAVNFGTGETVTVNHIATTLLKEFDPSLAPIHVVGRPGEVKRLCVDITKAKKLGFKPKVSFEEGIRRYVAWYKKFHSMSPVLDKKKKTQ